jgi:lysophospholipase-2
MPHLKFILPTAPTKPVAMNMGMKMPSWYDITGLDERSNEKCKGIAESQDHIQHILRTEHESTQLPYSRMVLAGFSQGGALSVFTGLQLPQKLAGVLMMSSYLPAAGQFTITPGLEDTTILHLHGSADPLVGMSVALKTKEILTGTKGATNYKLKAYPGLGHTINSEVLGDARKFLKTVLPPDDACKIVLKNPSSMSVQELRTAIKKAGLSQQAVGFYEKSEFVKLLENHRNGK